MKTCTQCSNELPINMFGKDKRAADGRKSACKSCLAQQQKEYALAHKDELQEYSKGYALAHNERLRQYNKEYRLKHKKRLNAKARAYSSRPLRQYKTYIKQLRQKYNMTESELRWYMDKQNGCCAVCYHSLDHVGQFHIDHDHNTGNIRGLLCHKCNHGLGLLGDTILGVKKALDYLLKHED